MLVTIEFTDYTPKLIIEAQEVVHCVNGLEKLIVDCETEIAFPIHRIKKITYNLHL